MFLAKLTMLKSQAEAAFDLSSFVRLMIEGGYTRQHVLRKTDQSGMFSVEMMIWKTYSRT